MAQAANVGNKGKFPIQRDSQISNRNSEDNMRKTGSNSSEI